MPEVVEAFLFKLPPQVLLDHLLRVVTLQLLHPLDHLRVLLHVVLQVLLLGQGLDLFLPLQWPPMTSMFLITFARGIASALLI